MIQIRDQSLLILLHCCQRYGVFLLRNNLLSSVSLFNLQNTYLFFITLSDFLCAKAEFCLNYLIGTMQKKLAELDNNKIFLQRKTNLIEVTLDPHGDPLNFGPLYIILCFSANLNKFKQLKISMMKQAK
jgi:hypothetical protein